MNITTSNTQTGLCRFFSYPRKLLLALLLVFSLFSTFSAKAFDPSENKKELFWDAMNEKSYQIVMVDDHLPAEAISFRNYHAKATRNTDFNPKEKGYEQYIIVLPYMMFQPEVTSYYADSYSCFYKFLIEKDWNGDYAESTDVFIPVEYNSTYNLVSSNGSTTPVDLCNITESGKTYRLKKMSKQTLSDLQVLPGFTIFNAEKPVYNVIIKINFDYLKDLDRFSDEPTSIEVCFETELKPRFIGTLSQTSENFDESKDKYAGWNTWVELQGTVGEDGVVDYPYTYSFIAQSTDYDFIVALENPFVEELKKDVYIDGSEFAARFKYVNAHPYFMFWNMYPNYYLQVNQNLNVPNEPYNNMLGKYLGTPLKFMGEFHSMNQINESIHLNSLIPGKRYQVVVDRPSMEGDYSMGNIVGGGGYSLAERVRLNGWISLMPQLDPSLFVYQLVEYTPDRDEESGTSVYYTYTDNWRKQAYRVVLDKDKKIIDYAIADAKGAIMDMYYKQTFLFTDMLWVHWENLAFESNSKVQYGGITSATTTKMLGFTGEIEFNGHTFPFETESPFSIKGCEKPLESKDFICKIKGYKYKQNYDVPVYELKSCMERDYVSTVMPVSQESRQTATVTFDFPSPTQATVSGQLAVPEPMPVSSKGEITMEYDRFTNTIASKQERTVTLRFYDQDIVRNGQEYFDTLFTLTGKEPIQAHDFHVTFPYYNPNVTSELYDLVRNGADTGEGSPYLQFQFFANGSKVGSDIFSATPGTPGFYNAHMGSIFGETGYQGNVKATLTMKPINADKYLIYERWSDMSATISMNLSAPSDASLPLEDESASNKFNVFRTIRAVAGENDLFEEAILMKGLSLTDSPDDVSGMNLMNQSKKDQTGLYIIKYPTGKLELVTAAEFPTHYFDIQVSAPFKLEDYKEPLIDVTKITNHEPFEVRNVYLFPKENDGLTAREDEMTQQSTDNVRLMDVENGFIYHALTTPPASPTVTLSAVTEVGNVSGINDVIVTSFDLARGGVGSAELLSDGTALYNMQGVMVADRAGRHSLVPGIYVARKENRVQKIVVK